MRSRLFTRLALIAFLLTIPSKIYAETHWIELAFDDWTAPQSTVFLHRGERTLQLQADSSTPETYIQPASAWEHTGEVSFLSEGIRLGSGDTPPLESSITKTLNLPNPTLHLSLDVYTSAPPFFPDDSFLEIRANDVPLYQIDAAQFSSEHLTFSRDISLDWSSYVRQPTKLSVVLLNSQVDARFWVVLKDIKNQPIAFSPVDQLTFTCQDSSECRTTALMDDQELSSPTTWPKESEEPSSITVSAIDNKQHRETPLSFTGFVPPTAPRIQNLSVNQFHPEYILTASLESYVDEGVFPTIEVQIGDTWQPLIPEYVEFTHQGSPQVKAAIVSDTQPNAIRIFFRNSAGEASLAAITPL